MDINHITQRGDVVVVGARCAGAATAMLLARQGHDVVVVDRAEFPSDTLSTHSIARGGVTQLARWGLLDRVLASGAPPIRQVSFHTPDGVMTRTIKHRAGVDHLVAPRRHVLDALLLDAAREAGARVETGVTIDAVSRDTDGRACGVSGRTETGTIDVHARFVVGADGLRSRVATAVDAAVLDERHRNGAASYAYFGGLDWEGIEFHLAEGTMAGVFPTHGGEANVWICGSSADLAGIRGPEDRRTRRFLELIDACSPSLAARLRASTQTTAIRGLVGMPNRVRQPVGPGWALVGDAGYFRDAVTGHGITDAFRDAELLARAVSPMLFGDVDEASALQRYATDRSRMMADLFRITVRLAEYPPLAEFVELQRELSARIELEAEELASWPTLERPLVAA